MFIIDLKKPNFLNTNIILGLTCRHKLALVFQLTIPEVYKLVYMSVITKSCF